MPWEVSKKGNNFLPWFLGVKIENKQKSLISYVHRDSVIWLKNNKHWYIFLSDRFWIESQLAPCFLAKRLWKSYISYLNFGFFNCQKTVLMYTDVMASKLGRICVALSTVLKNEHDLAQCRLTPAFFDNLILGQFPSLSLHLWDPGLTLVSQVLQALSSSRDLACHVPTA